MSERDDTEVMAEELPPRPRNRLLTPLPLALIAVLLIAGGFLVGVLVQKGSEGGNTPTGLPSGFPSLTGAEGSMPEGAGGFPSIPGGSSDAAVSGTVASVDGRTVYVKDSEGSTVAVRVEDGSKVSRDSNVGVKKIRPGDSVVVQGAKYGSTVKASSIAATESGVETSGSAELFGE